MIAATEPPLVVYAGRAADREVYQRELTRAAGEAGLTMRLVMDPAEADPAEVDYMVFGAVGFVTDFAPYTRLKAVLNLWAGVEALLALDPPQHLPLVRMVEDGLTLGMIDYVCAHVLRHHMDLDRYIRREAIGEWESDYPPLARNRQVAILGLGTLGTACAEKLANHGFRVSGWSRSAKSVPGITCHHGAAGLESILAGAEILVLLLPQTPETRHIVNAESLARLPRRAVVAGDARHRFGAARPSGDAEAVVREFLRAGGSE
ncbi:MAG: NAD(P)-dependent oxidoreductase, partial [Pseudomonadota bacterium]